MERHEHKWSKMGIMCKNRETQKYYAVQPCLIKDCPAGRKRFIEDSPTGGRRFSDDIPFEYDENAYPSSINGIDLDIEDDEEGGVTKIILKEIRDDYNVEPLSPSDVVIDIGAHVGIVSIYLAKKYGCRVLAYEPVHKNYMRAWRNIRANGVVDLVSLFNLAVTGDGRDIELYGGLSFNSGGSSIFGKNDWHNSCFPAGSITLKEIITQNNLDSIALLKIDCEGLEYEIINESISELAKVKAVRGEFHNMNGESAKTLRDMVTGYVSDTHVILQG